MATKYLDYNGLLYFWQKIKTVFALATHTHTTSQITDFPSSMPPSSHTHGNIQNGGGLQTTDITIASGDKLVVTDNSDSNKVARTSISFDGSTATKALTQKGTWETFNNYTHPAYTATTAAAKKIGCDSTGHVVFGTALTASDVGALPSSTTIPSAGTGSSYPLMDGTKSLGSQAGYARVDHVHPSDTTKVDKENGKGLSANDYTTTEKNKLANIANGADVTRLTLAGSSTGSQVVSGDTMRFIGGGGFITTAAGYSQDEEPQITISLNSSKINVASGLLQLNSSAKIDSTYLPSYVDDVIEAYPRSGQTELSSTWLATGSASGTVITPESGKIYILMADSTSYGTNAQFRWGGSTYFKLNDGGISSITNAEIDTIVAS